MLAVLTKKNPQGLKNVLETKTNFQHYNTISAQPVSVSLPSSAGLRVYFVLWSRPLRVSLPRLLSFKRLLFSSLLPPECAQRGPTLNQSPGPIRCVLEKRKLKSSKVPPCPPPLNLQVAPVPRLGTGTVPRGLKRPVKPPARQPRPIKLKLTHGAHTTPAV